MALSTRPEARPIDYAVLAETLILAGTATLLLVKWLRGQLSFYIHPRYTALMLVAALVLLLMAAVRGREILRSGPARPMSWAYLLLAVPLLLGTLVPARPLGADTLAGRGVELNNVAGSARARGDDTAGWNLLDWAGAITLREEELIGRPVDVVGFVFHAEGAGVDSFYAVRYVITCCAADGAGVGLPVIWPSGGALPVDSWVRVRGTLAHGEAGGAERPVVQASAVEPVEQPQNPYLYP